jgi:hypothetical protein
MDWFFAQLGSAVCIYLNMKPRTKRKRHQAMTIGQRIIQGLGEALAWSRGEDGAVRLTVVRIPKVKLRGLGRISANASGRTWETAEGLAEDVLGPAKTID